MDINQEFTPTKVCGQFMLSTARVRAIVGPVGSSKTTTCLYEIVRRAAMQEPSPNDGKRYTRFAIVRNTLKSLKDTVLKDFQQVFGDIITFKVSESTIYIKHGDIDCEILLIPLEYEDDQKRLLSAQLTGIYFNEFSEMSPDFVSPALGRCGRYPSQQRGKPSWYGIILDSNPGTEDSPWYDKLKLDRPSNWEYFEQPPPLKYDAESDKFVENPDAENIENLPGGYEYYYNLMESATPDWIGRYVLGNWGRSLEGVPVFKGRFDEEFHVSQAPLMLSYDHPIIIGMDFSRAPAAIFGQINKKGILQIKHEEYALGKGVELFVREQVMPILMEEWAVGRPVFIVGDPSGRIKDRRDIDDFAFLRSVGFIAKPAPTNNIDPRIAAVDSWLLQNRAGEPAIKFDATGCPNLILAMSDHYRYKKKRNGELEDKPDKRRPWADLVDGLQYLCLGTNERMIGQVMRQLKPKAPPKPAPPAAAWT